MAIVAVEIAAGLPIDRLLATRTRPFTVGGLVPSVRIGPAFALLVAQRR